MRNFACILIYAFIAFITTVESGVSSSNLYNNPQYQRYVESDNANIQWDQDGRPYGRIINGVFMRFENVPQPGEVTFKDGDELYRLGERKAVYHDGKFYQLLPNGAPAEFEVQPGDLVLSNSVPHAVRKDDGTWRHYRHKLVHE